MCAEIKMDIERWENEGGRIAGPDSLQNEFIAQWGASDVALGDEDFEPTREKGRSTERAHDMHLPSTKLILTKEGG
jgi:hypothetical protein